jgi:4-amino-4-deoxy-L-arabinose transferase-like glycosyltransferase
MNSAASIPTSTKSIDLRNRSGLLTRTNLLLFPILATAFLLRCVVRFSHGEDYFWKNSYDLFFDAAQSFKAGHGLCYETIGLKCAHRPPVYPLLLFFSTLWGDNYFAIVIVQSLLGAGTALCAYLIAKDMFDKRTGLLAALAVGCYPYFVMHDTALQETGLFTFLTALAIVLMLKGRKAKANIVWGMSGIALGLAVLTRTTVALFVPVALLWVIFVASPTMRRGVPKALIIALGLLLVVGPWLLRNYLLLGEPALTTMTGLQLWIGNNPYTFSHYPAEGIDQSTNEAVEKLPPEELQAVLALANDEVAQTSWFTSKAFAYMKAHPQQTIAGAFKKLGAAFSWRQNPARENFVQTVYFLSYVPALLLGIFGAWLSRRQWKEQSLIYGLFLSFLPVTAVFFAHTSHRAYLDVYLLIFAAYAAWRLFEWATKTRSLGLPEHNA